MKKYSEALRYKVYHAVFNGANTGEDIKVFFAANQAQAAYWAFLYMSTGKDYPPDLLEIMYDDEYVTYSPREALKLIIPRLDELNNKEISRYPDTYFYIDAVRSETGKRFYKSKIGKDYPGPLDEKINERNQFRNQLKTLMGNR